MELKVFSRRWGHDDIYHIKKISTGWNFNHSAYSGDCNKKGESFLFESLKHDTINYPFELGYYLERIWEISEQEDKSDEWIQEQLNKLSLWIKVTEESTPKFDFE